MLRQKDGFVPLRGLQFSGWVADHYCKWRVCGLRAWRIRTFMIRKLKSGEYRLYSRKKDEATGKRRNLGTFPTREKAKKHEQEVQYFKRH